jgi:acetyl esterase/lipase
VAGIPRTLRPKPSPSRLILLGSYVPPEHACRLASALAASGVPHAVHVFTHGPHGLGLAQDAGEAATWTTLATTWIHEQVRVEDEHGPWSSAG